MFEYTGKGSVKIIAATRSIRSKGNMKTQNRKSDAIKENSFFWYLSAIPSCARKEKNL
jgi:hypothetical protein